MIYYSTASLSEIGDRRDNQDRVSFTVKDHINCWVVADGLGGHPGGDVAAAVAVDSFIAEFERLTELSVSAINDYIQAAHMGVIKRQEQENALRSMRTTLVALVADQSGAIWAHTGDSRLYHFREFSIIFQTKDHSRAQEMVDTGIMEYDDIRGHVDRNALLRSLGNAATFDPAVERYVHAVQPGDAFLLCTDGFWEFVTEREMGYDLMRSETPEEWLEKMSMRVAGTTGIHDNYSAVAVFAENCRPVNGSL